MKSRQITRLCCQLCGVILLGISGCRSSVRVTDTAQTGSQQLLLNASFDAVVQSIDFCALANRTAFLDTTGLGDVQKGYLAYRIREQMGFCGVLLAQSRDDAEIVVEAGLSAYGTDSNNLVVGFTDSDQLPKIDLCVRDTQFGVSKLSMFAYEPASGRLVWQAGPMRADAYQSSKTVLGLGPFYSGTIRHPAHRVGWRASNSPSR